MYIRVWGTFDYRIAFQPIFRTRWILSFFVEVSSAEYYFNFVLSRFWLNESGEIRASLARGEYFKRRTIAHGGSFIPILIRRFWSNEKNETPRF